MNETNPFAEEKKGSLSCFRDHPMIRGILRFFLPDQCAVCKECGWTPLCPSCREALRQDFQPRRFLCYGGNGFADRMLALFPYDSIPAKILVLDWKRDNFPEIAQSFESFLRRAAKSSAFFRGIDLVTFAPRRTSARRRAGFDQGEELAKAVSRVIGCPFRVLLERRGVSRAQHRLSTDSRRANVRGVFRPVCSLAGETVLLVDDVVTTGASVQECARVLKRAGAQKVFVLCLAHPFLRKEAKEGKAP